jgi:transcriptional regulator with XRE-family HTH domain
MSTYYLNEKDYSLLHSMSLGKKVRYFRNLMSNLDSKTRYSTAELAKRIGVTPQSLTSIERDETKRPSFEVIHKLSKELGVPMEIFTDDFYETGQLPDISLKKDNKNYSIQIKASSSQESCKYRVGYLLYQYLEDEQIRILLHEETNGAFDNTQLVKILAQQISAIQLNNLINNEDSVTYSTNRSPYDEALSLCSSLETDNKDYPKISKKVWDMLIRDFYKHAEFITDEEDDNNDQY